MTESKRTFAYKLVDTGGNTVTILAEFLYTLAEEVLEAYLEDSDHEHIMLNCVKWGLFERHIANEEEAEIYEIDKGDYYYHLGSQEQMIKRLEGKK